jgi:hypothetical protein
LIAHGLSFDRCRLLVRRGPSNDTLMPGSESFDAVRDILVSGLAGAALSGLPSSAWSLAVGDDLLAGARAAGALVLSEAHPTSTLLVAAVPVHLGLSLGWAAVLAAVLPHGAGAAWGAAGGLAIAALDLGVIGRRVPAIRALPQARQWADHVAYGITVALVLRARRT